MTEQEMKNWIDQASYEDLLARWRFAPAGSPWFAGEMGDYYSKVMLRKRDEIGPNGAVRASKVVGWEKPD